MRWGFVRILTDPHKPSLHLIFYFRSDRAQGVFLCDWSHICASWTSSNISNHIQLSYSSRMSSSLTKYVDYTTLPTGIPSKLPASVKNLEIEKYLTDFAHEIRFTDRIEVDDARKMRKITFNHTAAIAKALSNSQKPTLDWNCCWFYLSSAG